MGEIKILAEFVPLEGLEIDLGVLQSEIHQIAKNHPGVNINTWVIQGTTTPGRGVRGGEGMEVEKKPTAPAGQERERLEKVLQKNFTGMEEQRLCQFRFEKNQPAILSEVGSVPPEKMNTYLEKIKKGQSTINGIRQELGLPPIKEGDLLLKKRN